MMIIIRQRQSDSHSPFFLLLSMPGVDVDKCTVAPTVLSTKAPTPTNALTALPTKAPNCQFADGKPGTKCDGLNACVGIDTSNIKCGSCNGKSACAQTNWPKEIKSEVFVEENSCNGVDACTFHILQVLLKKAGNAVIGKNSW
jgi:hypothetical protein